MTPTTPTHGPESDDGRQDAPGATDSATEAREAIDLDGIEARAKVATPGPWERRIAPREGYTLEEKAEYMRGSAYDNGQPLQVLIAESPTPDLAYVIPALTGDGPTSEANAEHIAGMDPEQTLALVAEVRELRAKVARVGAECDARHISHSDDRITALILRAERAEAEVEALRAHDYLQVASMNGYAVDLAAAEAERDDLRARLARWEGHRCWNGTEGVNSAGPRKQGPNTAGPR